MTSHSPHAAGAYTWDDFIALEDEDQRELIDGELVEIDVPTFAHGCAVARLIAVLANWGDVHGGRAIASGYKVRVSERRGVMPDLQFYRRGNEISADQNQGLVRGRPDLVVEVVSSSSRRYDRVKKLNWYAQLGVPEYWIVDPETRTLERLVLRDGGYLIAVSLEGDETFRPHSFHGMELPLPKLWT